MAGRLILAVALVAALVPVAGAGGADGQTPKRGGTVVFAQVPPEPACLNPLDERCRQGTAQITLARIAARVLEAPFDVGPDLTWRPRLVSSVTYTKKPPFALTYHIRPEARWNDGRPITAADFVFTHQAIRKQGSPDDWHRTEVRSVRALDATAVKVVLRSRLAGWRGLFGSILPRHALRGADLLNVWRDRIENPKTGQPIGSGPFLIESWDRGTQITLRRNSRYWGPIPPTSTGSCSASRSTAAPWSTGSGAEASTSQWDFRRASSPRFGVPLASGRSPFPARAGITSRSAWVPAATRLSGTSRSGGHWRSESIAVGSCGRCSETSIRELGSARVSST